MSSMKMIILAKIIRSKPTKEETNYTKHIKVNVEKTRDRDLWAGVRTSGMETVHSMIIECINKRTSQNISLTC